MTAPGTRPGSQRRRRMTVTGGTVLVAVVVATVAALVAGAVSVPMIRSAAESRERQELSRLADLTAAGLEDPRPGTIRRLQDLLAARSTDAYIVGAGLPLPPGVDQEMVDDLVAGRDVSTSARVDGGRLFLEGRPIGDGQAVVLSTPLTVTSEPVVGLLRRLAVALIIGLAVAVAVAIVASRRLTRPLRSVAETAERLTAGERNVHVAGEGPAEVAEIAESLNRLDAALTVSEGRQQEFLLSVSHELRTPLTAVNGYAEALSDGMIPESEVPRVGEILTRETSRMERLVADLLDLSRLGAADLRIESRSCDLAAVLGDAAAVWRDRCEREGIIFGIELPGHPVVLVTDPLRVRQIVDNLAENALRVTPRGRPIVFGLTDQPDRALLEVRDGGPGLTDDDMAVAFEPAALYVRYQGLRPVGSGVGLALVGRLAQRLGGSAAVDRAPEGGAAFSVILPRGSGVEHEVF